MSLFHFQNKPIRKLQKHNINQKHRYHDLLDFTDIEISNTNNSKYSTVLYVQYI